MTWVMVVSTGWIGVAVVWRGGRRWSVLARLTHAGPSPKSRLSRPSWMVRRRAMADDLPDLLDDLARSLRSGLSLRQALFALPAIGALAAPTVRMRHELEAGRPIGAATKEWVEQIDDPLADLAGAALALVIDAGGTGAAAIDRVAATVRDRRALRLEAEAQASQAKASAVVIAALPVGFFALVLAADPEIVGFLFGTPVGLTCLIGGLGLDALGLWWMQRITETVRW